MCILLHLCAVQDFLTVCCPEIGANPKTLGVLPTTTIQQLAEQCAARFEQGKCLKDTAVTVSHITAPSFVSFAVITPIFVV